MRASDVPSISNISGMVRLDSSVSVLVSQTGRVTPA